MEVDLKYSVFNRMDIFKVSSGYGIGLDEEEKDEVVYIFYGKFVGSRV